MLDRFVTEVHRYTKNNENMLDKLNWSLTGGEPTIHPELDKLLRVFPKHGKRTSIMTNGQLHRGVETVIDNKNCVSFLRVSLESGDRDVNDSIRGVGTFDKTISSIREYMANGLRIMLGFTVHSQNMDAIETCLELGRDLGVHGVAIWPSLQYVQTASSETRNKSLKKGEDVVWDDSTFAEYRRHQQLVKKYQHHFKGVCSISNSFIGADRRGSWTCTNWNPGNQPIIDRMVLLPDGKLSQCCDMYDIDYDATRFEPSPYNEDPVNNIFADFTTQTIEQIVDGKVTAFSELIRRRIRDAKAGLLENGRENICTNCAYYHYQPRTGKKVIEIKQS